MSTLGFGLGTGPEWWGGSQPTDTPAIIPAPRTMSGVWNRTSSLPHGVVSLQALSNELARAVHSQVSEDYKVWLWPLP